jgi:hypothetical protein
MLPSLTLGLLKHQAQPWAQVWRATFTADGAFELSSRQCPS